MMLQEPGQSQSRKEATYNIGHFTTDWVFTIDMSMGGLRADWFLWWNKLCTYG